MRNLLIIVLLIFFMTVLVGQTTQFQWTEQPRNWTLLDEVETVYIGDPDSNRSLSQPINYLWENNISQVIYYDNEITATGLITRLAYAFFGDGTVPENLQYRVYLATTNQLGFTSAEDFISPDEFTLVFDGNLPFSAAGFRYVTIELDTPYVYTGGNLAVMVHRLHSSFAYASNNYFRATEMNGLSRSLDIRDSAPLSMPPQNMMWTGSSTAVPNILLSFMTSGMGTISGVVTNNGSPLSDVKISLNDSSQVVYTDVNGEYSIPYVLPGMASITATKHGFHDVTISNIPVIAEENTERNFSMQEIIIVNLSGSIIASDTGLGLSGAIISLTGYHDYLNIETNIQGNFVITNVYAGFEYTLTVTRRGYDTFIQNGLFITETHSQIEPITLNETPNPVWRVVAVEEDNNVKITWETPTIGNAKWFSHIIKNTPDNYWGYWDRPINLTAMHRFTPAMLADLDIAGTELTQMSIFGGFGEGHNHTIQIYIGGSGNPLHPGTLVHSQAIVLLPEQWTNIILSSSVTIPINQELWIGYHATAPTQSFPASVTDTDNAIVGFGDVVNWGNGEWTTIMESEMYNENWMIRGYAEGVEGKRVFTITEVEPISKILYTKRDERKDVSPIRAFPTNINNSNITDIISVLSNESDTRVLLGYNVYRVNIDDLDDENKWQNVALNHSGNEVYDYDWSALPTSAAYRYIVKALYSNDVLSPPSFSNILTKDMLAEITFNVTTDDEVSANGASVRLSNNSGNPEHVYTGSISGGSINITGVWKGTYTLTILLNEYEDFIVNDFIVMDSFINSDIVLLRKYIIMTEGFEESIFPPTGWTLIDDDGDTHNWRRALSSDGYPTAFGTALAVSDSWIEHGGPNGTPLRPDNYLVTLPIDLTDKDIGTAAVIWNTTSWDPQYPIETYSVMVSTTTPQTASFTDTIHTETLDNARIWQRRTASLNDFVGQTIHIAFRHHDSHDQFQIVLDEIEIYYTQKKITSESGNTLIPIRTALKGNYPNPFNPITNIIFDLNKNGNVSLEIFNIRGQRVKILTDDYFEAGSHQIEWKGTDDFGRDVSSGIYFYQMKTDGFIEIKRMLLMK